MQKCNTFFIAILIALLNAYYSSFMKYNCFIGGVQMAFQLKPNRKESENKTIRFPISLIQEIETVIASQDVTFSSFVLQACEYALKNMDTSEHESK